MFRFFYLSLHVAVRSFTTTILQIIDVFVKPRCSRDVIFHLFKRCHCSNHKLANLLKYKEDPLHVVGRKLVTLFPVMFLLLFYLLFGCTLTILILDYETHRKKCSKPRPGNRAFSGWEMPVFGGGIWVWNMKHAKGISRPEFSMFQTQIPPPKTGFFHPENTLFPGLCFQHFGAEFGLFPRARFPNFQGRKMLVFRSVVLSRRKSQVVELVIFGPEVEKIRSF